MALRALGRLIRAAAAVIATTLPLTATQAVVSRSEEDLEVYFGAGCFWHTQSVVVQAELEVLHRNGSASATGIAGYAGGSDNAGDVCYTDYARRGHAEVVAVRIPRPHLADFAGYVYRRLFRDGDRRDAANRGRGYRAALGFPGGMDGTPDILKALVAKGFGEYAIFAVGGSGGEGDTLGERRIYVYDSGMFPFHQAELYHQFHGFHHREELLRAGELHETSCPPQWRTWFSVWQAAYPGAALASASGAALCLLAAGAHRCRRAAGCRARKVQQILDGAMVQLAGGKA